ncbi:Pimeloyl-CoA dehydrogenase (Small subunit) [Cupriavidus necator]|uniref:Acyl-CoA dehydrogenase n=1 Tax=Cupriavidus necator (strain ATCC 17699 / DSM 428 / KCTC 22496 / NCIMB 10442 / H16 / Stanier 337) TaxID=381666 RepID=Q0K4A2_CUPNH|nr:acyl-CoA dehydrogenase family protein [Cupriavidus necator]QCC03099.1 acyl-CoA dehydrogenase [Cupriavidus necator H16]QQB80156.1 acyl-CoA dehydrogenase family protein [Cupriavidus necator]WKA44415.1 acyl-CoA dehydrogenase family protein [Cupriavidus necator]CAJ95172.1 Pimeloyl-CoA dehydrogenase (small subunit) [Cupriavidus necator H16]
MNFNLNDEQRQLADSLSRLLADHYSFEKRRALTRPEATCEPAIWTHLAALGVTALGIPEAFGGLGGGTQDRLPVMQAFGRALAIEPYLASAVLGTTAVREGGSSAQQAELLPSLASGEMRIAWAHDEAAGRHAPLWVETTARSGPDGWRLDGAKALVLHGGAVSRIVVTARTRGKAQDEDGLALFLVDPQADGVTRRAYRLVDDTPAVELTLRNAQACPLGDVSDSVRATAVIRATQAAGIAAACADMVGTMETALQLTTDYVRTRKQFGRPIGDYQSMRHRIADMCVSLELARSMAVAAAVAGDDPSGDDGLAELSRAKLVIGRHARTLCHAAIQSHGGIGLTEEYAVGHCLRRVHVLDQLFGDCDAHTRWLAGQLG